MYCSMCTVQQTSNFFRMESLYKLCTNGSCNLCNIPGSDEGPWAEMSASNWLMIKQLAKIHQRNQLWGIARFK